MEGEEDDSRGWRKMKTQAGSAPFKFRSRDSNANEVPPSEFRKETVGLVGREKPERSCKFQIPPL